MSIYAVHLFTWAGDDEDRISTLRTLCCVMTCDKCGKRLKYKRAWGHHSIFHGVGEVWCNAVCAGVAEEGD